MKHKNLEPSQADRVLAAIARGNHMNADISRVSGVPGKSVGRVCTVLAERGLVRRRDDRDGRGFPAEYELTARGVALTGASPRARPTAQPQFQSPSSERDTILMRQAAKRGSELLLASLRRQPGGDHSASRQMQRKPSAVPHRDVPIAAGREPCPLCATRGDIGCRHQRPCEPALSATLNDEKGTCHA